jgi:PAS domain S-box-containing protein
MNYLKKELYELVRSDTSIFDLIQDTTLDGLWYWDLENPENEWMSPKFWRALGYDPDEMPHKISAWQHIVHPDDLRSAINNFHKHCEDPNHPCDQVLRFIHKNGSTVWIRCRGTAIRNKEGKAIRMLVSNIDITREKEIEDNHKILFNSIDEGFCIIEMIFDEQGKPADYRFLTINASFERQTGMKDAAGKRMREFAPDHEEHWFEIYGNIALTGQSARFENRAEQLHRWYDVYAFQFGDPKNFQVGILFNDITQRKLAEEKLLAANKELEAFSYSVAHDLRAPLRSIHGYTEVLNQDYNKMLDAEGVRILENIKHNASKMGQLIDDLLAFSRLGRKEIQMSKIDMTALTQDILGELKRSVSHQAEITMLPLDNVMGDYNLLCQVMFNLISNAVKYSSKKASPVIQISSEVKNDEIVFSIKDNGAGFDMRYANKLFGVFRRLHSDREFEGTGIGLAIVYRIVSKHGGSTWAEGKVDEGATFYFTLPKNNSL